MATLSEQIEVIITDLVANEARLDVWINGDNATDYTASGGETIPSVQKLIAETLKWQGDYTPGGTAYTIGQTFKEVYIAYKVIANFTSTTFGADAANYEILFDLSNVVTAAEVAETAAAVSETNAGNSAAAASASETNAGNSAAAASASETNAGNSAAAASASETNAAASAVAAAPIALGVVDPTAGAGVAADLHTEGYTNETPPRYFKKVGAGDTDWALFGIESGNVFLYGAKGDGVADDTFAIQDAINSVVAQGGGKVLISSGTFLLTTQGTINSKLYCLELFSKVELVIGANATLKLADGQQTDGGGPVNIIVWQANQSDITIRGGGLITGNTAGQPGWTGGYSQGGSNIIVSYGQGDSRIHISDLRLEDHWSNPINLGNSPAGDRLEDIHVENIRSKNTGEGVQVIKADRVVFRGIHHWIDGIASAGDGIEISVCTHFLIDGCQVVVTGGGSGAGGAIDVYGSKDGLVSNFFADGWNDGISTSSPVGELVQRVVVDGAVFRNLTGSQALSAAGEVTYRNCSVYGMDIPVQISAGVASDYPFIMENCWFEDTGNILIRSPRPVIWRSGGMRGATGSGVLIYWQDSVYEGDRNIYLTGLNFAETTASPLFFSAVNLTGVGVVNGSLTNLQSEKEWGISGDILMNAFVHDVNSTLYNRTIQTFEKELLNRFPFGLEFYGGGANDQYISSGWDPGVETDLTVIIWCTFDAGGISTGGGHIFSLANNVVDTSAANHGVVFRFDSSNSDKSVGIDVADGSTKIEINATGFDDSVFTDGKAHCLAFSYDQSTGDVRFYLDGDFKSAGNIGVIPWWDAIINNAYIFGNYNGQRSPDGSLRTASVFSSVLSDSEIKRYSLSPTDARNHADLEFLYILREGSGTTVLDRKTNGGTSYDGTVNFTSNAPRWF